MCFRSRIWIWVGVASWAGCPATDECPTPDQYWCSGSVVEGCHEGDFANYVSVLEDCADQDAQCVESEDDARCALADLSCDDSPSERCEGERVVRCVEGWSAPLVGTDCVILDQFCVETDLGTAGCSRVADACSSDGPQTMCIGTDLYRCVEGFWDRAASAEDLCAN